MMKTKPLKKNTPKGWERVRLGDVARLHKGLTYKSSHYSNEQNGMIFLTLKSIRRGGGFNVSGIKYYAGDFDNNAVVKEGDLVIANTDITRDAEVVGAPMLLPKLHKQPVLISMDLSVFDVDEKKADGRFLYYLLQATPARNFMRDHSSGSTVLHLKTKDVPEFAVTIPPVAEQKRIAEILTTVDEEIQKIDEIISATEKLKRGLMQRLFTRGIGHTKFKKTEIGEIPVEWSLSKLKDVAKFTNGKAHEKDIKEDGKYIVINSKFISTNGGVIKRSDKNLSPLFAEDIAMVMSDIPKGKALAKCFLVEENDKYTLNQRICSLRATKMVDKFLYYILNRNPYFLGFDNGVGQTNLRKDEVLGCPVQVPHEGEQREIVELLSSVDEKIAVNRKLKAKLTTLKKGLMQDLLSGKKRTI